MTEAERRGLIIYDATNKIIRINMPPRPPITRNYDLFGHYIAGSGATFKPKDKVRINTLGPFSQQFGYIVSFEGNDRYLVNITPKDKSSITLTFHRSELISVEKP